MIRRRIKAFLGYILQRWPKFGLSGHVLRFVVQAETLILPFGRPAALTGSTNGWKSCAVERSAFFWSKAYLLQ
jgi:hypothetical protein